MHFYYQYILLDSSSGFTEFIVTQLLWNHYFLYTENIHINKIFSHFKHGIDSNSNLWVVSISDDLSRTTENHLKSTGIFFFIDYCYFTQILKSLNNCSHSKAVSPNQVHFFWVLWSLPCAVLSCSIVSSCLHPHGCMHPRQAPLSVGILQARILEWVAMPSSREPA